MKRFSNFGNPWPLIGGALLSIVILFFWQQAKTRKNFNEFAFNEGTSGYFAKADGRKIHCNDGSDSHDCLEANGKSYALWLGNSQLHGVNQYRSGQQNSTYFLYRELADSGLDVRTFSQPNASFQEQYVLFTHLQTIADYRLLILPATFDDMRETGLRAKIADSLRHRRVEDELSKTSIGAKILGANQSVKTVATPGDEDNKGIAETVQVRSERVLTAWLEDHLPIWADRPHFRSSIFGKLYVFRNTVFGINAQTKRKVIKNRYDDNLAAYEEMIKAARLARTKVIVYIAPIRNDVEIPYDRKQYESFKVDVEAIAGRHQAKFLNLEGIVPAQYWGAKKSTSMKSGVEIDFMHFQEPGHRILATYLAKAIAGQM